MAEVAPLAVGAVASLEVGEAFLGFILFVFGVVLAEFLYAVGELALGVVLAVAGLEVVAAEFVLEFEVKEVEAFVLGVVGVIGEWQHFGIGELPQSYHYII